MSPKLTHLAALCCALGIFTGTAQAQVYKWVDGKGVTHYTQDPPPAGVKAKVIDATPQGFESGEAGEAGECHTITCQGERMQREKLREAERDALEARERAERAKLAPKSARGLAFEKYIQVQRGMSEGVVLTYTGEPDEVVFEGARSGGVVVPGGSSGGRGVFEVKSFYFYPTASDPFTTRIIFTGGMVSEISRVKKF